MCVSAARCALHAAAGDAGPLGLIGQGPGSGGGGKDAHGLTRKNLRTRSQAIKALVEIVGTSGKIYQHLIDLCKVGAWWWWGLRVLWICDQFPVDTLLLSVGLSSRHTLMQPAVFFEVLGGG